MKALVLCAGRGTRLRPLTHTRPKAAMPIAGRPVLAHILAYLYRFGFDDVGVVISPDQKVLRTLSAGRPGQRVSFIIQQVPRGIAHAVAAAQDYLGDEPFLLYLGDNLTDENLTPAMQRFRAESPDAVIAVCPVPNPQAFGIAELYGDRVVSAVEKPAAPRGNLAIAGIYLLRPCVHEAIRHLMPSTRGEYEITDALAALITDGRLVLAHRMVGWWQDMGTPDGMLRSNALLLDSIGPSIAPGVSLESVSIEGSVVIEPGVRLQRVTLNGPLWIGADSVLEEAFVGPYTSVGEGARIVRASVQNSILLPGCRLQGPGVHLEDCLLGKGSTVEGRSGRAVALLLGDDGHLQLPAGGL